MLAKSFDGKDEYILIDDQLVVYDKVFACVKKGFHHNKKKILIVNGGPGTGKSVIALNLMSDLLRHGYNAHYATGSRAFTETLRKIIRCYEVPFSLNILTVTEMLSKISRCFNL